MGKSRHTGNKLHRGEIKKKSPTHRGVRPRVYAGS